MCEICKTNVPRTYFHSRSRIHKKKLFDRIKKSIILNMNYVNYAILFNYFFFKFRIFLLL